MELEEQKAIVEAILFAAGKEVEITTLMSALELSHKDVEILLNQILNTNFDRILTLYKNSMESSKLDMDTVSPLPHLEKNNFSKDELEHYISIGEDTIKFTVLFSTAFFAISSIS